MGASSLLGLGRVKPVRAPFCGISAGTMEASAIQGAKGLGREQGSGFVLGWRDWGGRAWRWWVIGVACREVV